MTRNVTAESLDAASAARFVLYSLCECAACEGHGKVSFTEADEHTITAAIRRCSVCRGEGRIRREVASATDEQALGLALVTCAREGEWDDGCPLGLLDREGETGKKWLVLPWQPSARNVTDAARTLAKSKGKGKA